MSKITATRIIEFDAGHRVMKHESKCKTLHGHRYKLEITAQAPELDKLGRVIDFSKIKEIAGSWIDNFWDHTTLVWDKDVKTLKALKSMPRAKEPFICHFNPTAENMAQYLVDELFPRLFKGTQIEITHVRLWETPNCYVDASLQRKFKVVVDA